MGGVKESAPRSFVNSTGLHSDEAVFHEVDAPNSVLPPDLIERDDKIDGVQLCSVDRDRRP